MAFFAVLANNVLVETLSLNTRITFGSVSYILIISACLPLHAAESFVP